MSISEKLDQLHLQARQNKWLKYFAVFNRIALAAGFIPSGLQKVFGERFTDLAVNHPMGHYLDALYQTGYYYTFIGLMQITAAVLLLIPRTATLGAVIYFPIILNICILSFAVSFDGSLLSSPLMLLANLYLLCWDYHKLKSILSFNINDEKLNLQKMKDRNHTFPKMFLASVITIIFVVILAITQAYKFRPRNTLPDCKLQCDDSKTPKACIDFCNCIHIEGNTLEKCMDEYKKATDVTFEKHR